MTTKKKVIVDDLMQQGYVYWRTEPVGRNFAPGFTPELTPREMLRLGVFGGKYMTDCAGEFPASWFTGAKLCPDRHDPRLNFFGVNASQSLAVWRRRGWIHAQDPRGWFQWYCRYYMGRRSADDARQIRRWRAIARHATAVRHHCEPGDLDCRRRQRQALLHWAYDSRRIYSRVPLGLGWRSPVEVRPTQSPDRPRRLREPASSRSWRPAAAAVLAGRSGHRNRVSRPQPK